MTQMNDNKRKVLIVDDVLRIGQLVAKLIHWDDLGMECLDIKNDSEEALAVIKEKDPDIVITDIRMPKISGLDMIKIAKQSGSRAEFIVISGYREFEYAKTALECGVENYILKPINEQEVNEALEKVNRKLIRRESVKELKQTADEGRRIIKHNYLRDIIENRDSNGAVYKGVELEGSIFRCIELTLDPVDLERLEEKTDLYESEKVEKLIEDLISPVVREALFTRYKNLHIYGLLNYDEEQKQDVKETVNTVLTKVQDMLSSFDRYVVTIGVGAAKSEISGIRESFEESYRASCNRLRYGTGRIIYYEMIPKPQDELSDKILEDHKETIINAIDSLNNEQLEHESGIMFSEMFCINNADLTNCYKLAEKLIVFVCRQIDPEEENTAGCKEAAERITFCGRITQLKEYVSQTLSEMLTQKKNALESRSVRPVRQAKEYMEEHFREKITLEDVADRIALNPIYFSTLFKKETGMNFSTYLVNIRMEKAKELLRTTNETIAQVSEDVGYRDSRYFSQLFKKTVGVKPALYRKLHY